MFGALAVVARIVLEADLPAGGPNLPFRLTAEELPQWAPAWDEARGDRVVRSGRVTESSVALSGVVLVPNSSSR
eukprot:1525834-Heterocapsa_arctica.AAC.1